MKKFVLWLPRILAVLYIAFISMFALDVFGEPNWPLALFMHLIPSFILIALTIVAWNNEKIGGFIFIAAGIALLFFTHFESLVISIPALIIGVLFLNCSFFNHFFNFWRNLRKYFGF